MNESFLPWRIGYVVKRYPRYSETFIVNEILAHEAAGVEVQIFSLYPPNDTHFQDLLARVRAPVTYLDAETARDARFWSELCRAADQCPDFWPALAAGRTEGGREVYQAAQLARLARERGLTHLHAHFATAATAVARLAARFARLPFTFTAHAKDLFHESVDARDLGRKLNDAAAVVTVSDFNVRHLQRAFGDAARRVHRLYNGLDLARFPYADPAARPRRIVAVGRLVEKKGFDVLIAACAELRARGVRFECEVIGTGERERALREQIAAAELGDSVSLLGPRPQGELVQRVQSAAVLAAPCVVGGDGNADGLPTVLLEAMALGTACVSTEVTGIPEVVRSESTGLLVAPRAVSALARALERLLDDIPLRVRLARAARALIEAEFDVHRNAARQRELFRAEGLPVAAPEPWEEAACI